MRGKREGSGLETDNPHTHIHAQTHPCTRFMVKSILRFFYIFYDFCCFPYSYPVVKRLKGIIDVSNIKMGNVENKP